MQKSAISDVKVGKISVFRGSHKYKVIRKAKLAMRQLVIQTYCLICKKLSE
jgi:hypothetical protein